MHPLPFPVVTAHPLSDASFSAFPSLPAVPPPPPHRQPPPTRASPPLRVTEQASAERADRTGTTAATRATARQTDAASLWANRAALEGSPLSRPVARSPYVRQVAGGKGHHLAAPRLLAYVGTEPSWLSLKRATDATSQASTGADGAAPHVPHLLSAEAAAAFVRGFADCSGRAKIHAVALSLAVGAGRATLLVGVVLLMAGAATHPSSSLPSQQMGLLLPAIILLGGLLPAAREASAYAAAAQRFARLSLLAQGHVQLCHYEHDATLQAGCRALALQLRGDSDPVLRLAAEEWQAADRVAHAGVPRRR